MRHLAQNVHKKDPLKSRPQIQYILLRTSHLLTTTQDAKKRGEAIDNTIVDKPPLPQPAARKSDPKEVESAAQHLASTSDPPSRLRHRTLPERVCISETTSTIQPRRACIEETYLLPVNSLHISPPIPTLILHKCRSQSPERTNMTRQMECNALGISDADAFCYDGREA